MISNVYSSISILRSIAFESYSNMQLEISLHIKPKENGEPGNTITIDWERKSFKLALITIVFCGSYIEALLHQLMVKKLGKKQEEKYNNKSIDEKIIILGNNDANILSECKNFRASRKEIVHEKAYSNNNSIRFAQEEAKKSISLVLSIENAFSISNENSPTTAST